MGWLRIIFSQFRHARRYRKIFSVLLRYGFDDWVARLDVEGRMWLIRKVFFRARLRRARSMSRYERMRVAAEELGPTFIKFGQLLSSRQDLVPEGLIRELEKLQDGVPPFPASKARAFIEAETGKSISQLFKSFEDVPLASASIAQVHKAVLHDGRVVAVKVRRPDVIRIVEEDLRIMKDLAEILDERYPSLRPYDPKSLVRNFEESIRTELDFIHEATSIRRFAAQFAGHEFVHVPYVVDEISTPGVLAMEFVEGVKLTRAENLEASGLDRKIIAQRVVHSFFDQIFKHGFFQADPHPGNFLIQKNNVVCYLDFGMMGSILKRDMEQLGNLIMALAEQNVRGILKAIQELANIPTFKDKKKVEYDTNELVNTYAYLPDFHNHIGEILMALTRLLTRHGLKVPGNFFLLIRALFALEGLARKIDPQIKIYETLKPHLTSAIAEQTHPVQFGKRVIRSIYDLGSYLQEFPQDLRETMRMIKSGEIKVDLEHKGIDPVIYTFNRITRQLVASVITGSLVVGGALLHNAHAGPHWGGVPVISLVGYTLAGIIAFGMFISLMRNDKGY